MPLPVAAKAGAIAVSVAVAAAIAIYESPELRRNLDELRRRVAIALHALGDNMEPADRAPRFNRPEDAQGFLESRGSPSQGHAPGTEPGVDADEESRRRQREELMYWNAIRLEQMSRRKADGLPDSDEHSPAPAAVRGTHGRSTSFDDFLRQDANGERGSFVVNTSTNLHQNEDGLRRRADGPRRVAAAVYANPFADEHQIDHDELGTPPLVERSSRNQPADRMSDIYSSTTYDPEEARRILATVAPAAAAGGAAAATAALVDLAPDDAAEGPDVPARGEVVFDYDDTTAEQDERPGAHDEAYASIQAWAQGSSADFYSPLPMSPPSAPMSEPEVISEGMLTPTDSVSVIGGESSVHQGDEEGAAGRPYDVLSESEGMMTPASWSEIGSVVSESDSPRRVEAI